VQTVTVENFVRAETDRMFAGLASRPVNTWQHQRAPIGVDAQTVIRMNRDTLYSYALVDLAEGAELELPDTGGRYQSAMVVDRDHHVGALLHGPGRHRLDPDRFSSRHVVVLVRTLADPGDDADMASAHRVQDQLVLEASAAEPFVPPEYEPVSFTAVRDALLELARHWSGIGRAFGSVEDVAPVDHLLGTAAGWGGLPWREAAYVSFEPGLPVDGTYRLRLADVPVDGFWSVSVYGRSGYFEPNDLGAYNVNDLTATRDPDGSVSVHFGNDGDLPNRLPITEGWNYLVRLYRPRPEVLDGSWRVPDLERVD